MAKTTLPNDVARGWRYLRAGSKMNYISTKGLKWRIHKSSNYSPRHSNPGTSGFPFVDHQSKVSVYQWHFRWPNFTIVVKYNFPTISDRSFPLYRCHLIPSKERILCIENSWLEVVYSSNMTKNEVIVFKLYDSDGKKGSKSWRCPHTAFNDGRVGSIPRGSIDVRTICYFKYINNITMNLNTYYPIIRNYIFTPLLCLGQ